MRTLLYIILTLLVVPAFSQEAGRYDSTGNYPFIGLYRGPLRAAYIQWQTNGNTLRLQSIGDFQIFAGDQAAVHVDSSKNTRLYGNLQVDGQIYSGAAAYDERTVVVLEGHSIMEHCQSMVNPVGSYVVYESAIGGSRLNQIAIRARNSVDKHYSWAAGYNVCVLLGATNSICDGVTPVDAFRSIRAFVRERKKVGFDTIVCHMLSRTGFDAQKTALNALIDEEFPADRVLAWPAEFEADGASLNTTYFTDGIHLTVAARTQMAALISAKIQEATKNF